jgi:small subunit ribosomal protein S6e
MALKRRRSTKKREDAAEYAKLLALRLKEAKERKRSRSNSRTASTSKSETKA